MSYRDMKKPKNIWLMGDIHGDYFPIKNFYQNNKKFLSKDFRENILILLGDVGINYFLNHRDKETKDKLDRYPFTYFCIRGNHELRPSELEEQNPSEWHQEKCFENIVYVEDQHPKILYALDQGGEYIIGDKSILVIPGAYSIDKFYRLSHGWTWNATEQLSEKEKENLFNTLKPQYDYILSHTCPLSWQSYIQDLFLSQVDQSTVDNSMEIFLDKVAAAVKYDRWYWGHYHDNRDIPAVNGVMMFQEPLPLGMTYADYQKHCLIF